MSDERKYELVQSPCSAVLNYLSATRQYVGCAYTTAKMALGDMREGSKGLGAMERAIQSLSDAQGYVEEAMREIEG